MYPTTFIALVLGFWSSFHLLHTFLMNSTYFGDRLSSFIVINNISISYFHIRWFTTRWNRLFIKIARLWTSRLKLWFDLGIIFAAVAMIVGTILLVHTLMSTVNMIFFKPATPVLDRQVLSVVVPGVNLPIQDIFYLIPTILISGILHEIGHAVAAAREGIYVNGFGVFTFLIYPGAFVDLNSDDMNRKDPVSRLRVYCAGVWHNFIICLIVCVMLLSFPLLLYPFYTSSDPSVVVTYQVPDSPLDGSMGLRIGDHVIKVDSCVVTNTSAWFYCINKTKKTPQWGSCVPLSKIDAHMSHTAYVLESQISHGANSGRKLWMDCCDPQAPPTHLCYNYTPQSSQTTKFACLPGRVMVSTQEDCIANDDCEKSDIMPNEKKDIVCAKAFTEPRFKFIRLVAARENSEKHNVLYVGDPIDILRSVTVSDMTPRMSVFPLRLPSIFQRFLQYLFSMSGALALLNIVPCFALDGQWAFKAFLDHITLGSTLGEDKKDFICRVVLWLGTALLSANIFFGFIHLFTR